MPSERTVTRRTKRNTASQNKSLPKKLGKIPGMKDHTPSWAIRFNGVSSYTPEGPAVTSTGILDFRNDSPPVPPSADATPPSPRNQLHTVSDDGSPTQLPFAALLLSPTSTLPATPDPSPPSSNIYANDSANSSLDFYEFDHVPYQGDDALLPVMASLTPPEFLFPPQAEGSPSGHRHHMYRDIGSGDVDPVFPGTDHLALYNNSLSPHTWSLFQHVNQENVAGNMSPLDYSIPNHSTDNAQSSYGMSAIDFSWSFPLPSTSYVGPACNDTSSSHDIFSPPSPISIPLSRRRHNYFAHSPLGGATSVIDPFEEAYWHEGATHPSMQGHRFSPYERRQGRSYEPSPSLEGTSVLGLQFSTSAPASTSQHLFIPHTNSEYPSMSIAAPVPVSASLLFPEVGSTFLSDTSEYWSEANKCTELQ